MELTKYVKVSHIPEAIFLFPLPHLFKCRLFVFSKAKIKTILSRLGCYFVDIVVNIRQGNVHIGKMIANKIFRKSGVLKV